ncbi:hypothetical protein QTO34_006485 [Cnephaeus nilssonii]|uniref:Uncharacterized protein n=1 Tax=Cnephaeus nilssonii TaxID=3371016 RepID=A0AA40LII9_CNENI|nr:hypothetical protein QTO34_006485 [Eptesicus nilssonii]
MRVPCWTRANVLVIYELKFTGRGAGSSGRSAEEEGRLLRRSGRLRGARAAKGWPGRDPQVRSCRRGAPPRPLQSGWDPLVRDPFDLGKPHTREKLVFLRNASHLSVTGSPEVELCRAKQLGSPWKKYRPTKNPGKRTECILQSFPSRPGAQGAMDHPGRRVGIALPRGAEGTTPIDTGGKRPESSNRRLERDCKKTRQSTAVFSEDDADMNVSRTQREKKKKKDVDSSVVIARGRRGGKVDVGKAHQQAQKHLHWQRTAKWITPQFFKKLGHELHKYYHLPISNIFQENARYGRSENWRTSRDLQGLINGKCLRGTVKAAESIIRKLSQLIMEPLGSESEPPGRHLRMTLSHLGALRGRRRPGDQEKVTPPSHLCCCHCWQHKPRLALVT